jgi:hypothetical protein
VKELALLLSTTTTQDIIMIASSSTTRLGCASRLGFRGTSQAPLLGDPS